MEFPQSLTKTRQRDEEQILHLLFTPSLFMGLGTKPVYSGELKRTHMGQVLKLPANNVALASVFHRHSLFVAMREVLRHSWDLR